MNLAREIFCNMFMAIISGKRLNRVDWENRLLGLGHQAVDIEEAMDYLIEQNHTQEDERGITVAPKGCHHFNIHNTNQCLDARILLPNEFFQETIR